MDQFRRLAQSTKAEPPGGDSPGVDLPGGDPAALRVAEPAASALVTEALTDKEEKILERIAEGMSNRQIGAALFLAEGTIKNYVSRIMEKLHANTRTELAILSRKQRHPE
jgi:DNA-binding NarL/FixJ family response regulator